jgi:hypothetical protein
MLPVIVACEVGFWVLVLAGLVARYPLRRPRLGLVLLTLTPVVDVVLLATTALVLHRGGTAGGAHGLAAVYLGFSVAFGHAMIRWADVRFAHRWAGGPPPVRLHGRAHTAACWRDSARTALALAIAAAVLAALIAVSGDPVRSAALRDVFGVLGVIAVLELLWSTSYTLWPRKAPATS